jgi:hypothetical protein
VLKAQERLGVVVEDLADVLGRQAGLADVNEAYALHLPGEIVARSDPPERELAETYYRQALARAEALGMCPLQSHCHHGLGTLYAQPGRREQAHVELATAIDLYRAMGMTFWLPQAEGALAQAEGR